MAPVKFTSWLLNSSRQHQVPQRRQEAIENVRYIFIATDSERTSWRDESRSRYNVRQHIYVMLSNSIYLFVDSVRLHDFIVHFANTMIVPLYVRDVDLMELVIAFHGIPLTNGYAQSHPPYLEYVKTSETHLYWTEPAESNQQDENRPLTTDKYICEVEVMIFVSCDVMCGWLAKHLGLLHFEEIFEDMRRPSQIAKLKNLRTNKFLKDPLKYYITRKLFTGLNSVCVTSSLDVWKRARANYKGIVADRKRANSMSLFSLRDFTNYFYITRENCFPSNIEAVTKLLCLALRFNIAIPINYQVAHRRMVTVNVPMTTFLHLKPLKFFISGVTKDTTKKKCSNLKELFTSCISNILKDNV